MQTQLATYARFKAQKQNEYNVSDLFSIYTSKRFIHVVNKLFGNTRIISTDSQTQISLHHHTFG